MPTERDNILIEGVAGPSLGPLDDHEEPFVLAEGRSINVDHPREVIDDQYGMVGGVFGLIQ